MMLMEMNDEAACEACDGDTDVALGARTCRSRWRACSGRCWSSASPSPRGARELRRMQGAGDARLTVESRDPVGCVRSARGRLRGPCPGPGRGEVSVTDVELVMLRGGAAGRRWFRRVPLGQRNAGRAVRGQAGAAVARGGCASRGEEVCSQEPDRANGDRSGELLDAMTEVIAMSDR